MIRLRAKNLKLEGRSSETQYEIAVPVRPVRRIDAYGMAEPGEPLLLGRPNAVQHLKLEVLRRARMVIGELESDVDQGRVMSGQHRETAARHQDLHAAYI